MSSILKIFPIALIGSLLFAFAASAQISAGGSSILPKPDDPEMHKTMKEMLAKMQVAEAKKQYGEMLDRGDQAAKLADEIERSAKEHKDFTRQDREKLDGLEKLVKKIRGELGGEDGDVSEDDEKAAKNRPADRIDAAASLKELTLKMQDELRKTTRFSISAAAIERTNAVLRMIRFIRAQN